MNWLDEINWNEDGLVPAIAQDHQTGRILMMAWMNREALTLTVTENRAIYWSRSRGKLWRKGEESGHVQKLVSLHYDCDKDTILARVIQEGPACHTGSATCFPNPARGGRPTTWSPSEIICGSGVSVPSSSSRSRSRASSPSAGSKSG